MRTDADASGLRRTGRGRDQLLALLGIEAGRVAHVGIDLP